MAGGLLDAGLRSSPGIGRLIRERYGLLSIHLRYSENLTIEYVAENVSTSSITVRISPVVILISPESG